jgi:hypothetical protein
MFFRPSFCANCGEKIERSDWGLFTSRRFCPVCEVEFKGIDLLPRAVVAAGVLIGIFGFGSYLKSGGVEPRMVRLASQPVERPVSAAQLTQPPQAIAPPTVQQPSVASNSAAGPKTVPAVPPQTRAARNQPQDVVYMCGAMTKKGTPCSRRVHGPIRCYQHVGMPPMVPQEKLKIS